MNSQLLKRLFRAIQSGSGPDAEVLCRKEEEEAIRHTKTLFDYDGPQVSEASDAIGGHYVGVMVEPGAGEDRSLIKSASPESLRLFLSGALDLIP